MPNKNRRPATHTSPRNRGRPKDLDKRAAIMEAAKQLFASRGFAGVSMDAIAGAAGVSKLTVYSHFGSKDELFQTAVAEKCQDYTPPDFFDTDSPLPLHERLTMIGNGFIRLVMSKEATDFYRLLIAQAGSGSHLGKLFFAAGPAQNLRRLTLLLEHAHAAGELKVQDAHRAAGHFFSLLQGIPHLRVLIGETARIPAQNLREHVEDAVDTFLRAYRR